MTDTAKLRSALTPEMKLALDHLPLPNKRTKLSHIHDDIWFDGNEYVAVICGPDASRRQQIARAMWVSLKLANARQALSELNSEGEAVDRDEAIRIYAREAVLRAMHDHNGWPAPHMADDELLGLAEHTARSAVEAYLARLAALTNQGEGS